MTDPFLVPRAMAAEIERLVEDRLREETPAVAVRHPVPGSLPAPAAATTGQKTTVGPPPAPLRQRMARGTDVRPGLRTRGRAALPVLPAQRGAPAAVPLDPGARPGRTARPRTAQVRLGRGVLFENNFASALRALTQDGGYVEPAVPLLEFLPGSAISHYGRAIRARRFARGDVLVREGEPVESCYVVRSGVLRLLKDLPEGRGAVEIGRHGEGALIGEIGLLTDRTGYASAEALSEVEVDEIPDYLLADITDRFPELRRRLENASRQRLLAMTLATAPLFKVVPVGHRPALLRQFEPVQVQAGEAVLEGGEASPGLFLVLLGALVVCRPEEPDEAAAVATLRSGQHFGAAPLLTGEPCRETVIAARTCELAHLPAAGFYRLVADNPVLWRALRGV